jgi:methyltransferase
MVTSLLFYTALIAAVGLERLGELVLSRRNAARAFARGAVEVGTRHYRVMTVLHTLFLGCALAEPWVLGRAAPGASSWLFLVLVVLAQSLRYWAIATLGDRWNTRIIVLPGAEPVTNGPYRYVKHPNYLAVMVELAALPLVHGAWLTALVFSLANALLLVVRIRSEEAALGPRWARAFAGRPRFFAATVPLESSRDRSDH